MFAHGSFDIKDGFDDVSDILLSSLARGSITTFYLLKMNKTILQSTKRK